MVTLIGTPLRLLTIAPMRQPPVGIPYPATGRSSTIERVGDVLRVDAVVVLEVEGVLGGGGFVGPLRGAAVPRELIITACRP